MIKIFKNFLSLEECDELNSWTINHYSQPYFKNPNMDSYHKGTRFTTRGENKVINYIEENYDTIEKDMNNRNSTSKRKESGLDNTKTRKKREELSVSATKSIKKEEVEIVVQFH